MIDSLTFFFFWNDIVKNKKKNKNKNNRKCLQFMEQLCRLEWRLDRRR